MLGLKLEEHEAFPVPVEVVVTHIPGLDNLPNPADLARLRAVNHAMCDAVEATGREIKELDIESTVALGCLSDVQHLHHRQGRLDKRVVCEYAANYGQLEILQWARERLPVERVYVLGCGGGRASRGATVVARERLQVGCEDVHGRGKGRAPRGATVGRARTAARGTIIRARARQGAGTLRCYSGRARMASRGTFKRGNLREGNQKY